MQFLKLGFVLVFLTPPLFGMLKIANSYRPQLKLSNGVMTERATFNSETLIIKYKENPYPHFFDRTYVRFELYRKEETGLIQLGFLDGIISKNKIEIGQIRMYPQERGKQYGTFLINFAAKKYENRLKNSKVTWVASPDNPSRFDQLVSFYQKVGGRILEKNENGRSATMELDYKKFKAKL